MTPKFVDVSASAPCGLRVRLARHWGARMRGLLAYPPLEPDEALCITPCDSIHTFGMAYAIDVLFVSAQGHIMRRALAVPPWRISLCLGAATVFELPAGMAAMHEASLLQWWAQTVR